MNGLFGLNGLTGLAIAVVLLLAIVAGLGTLAIITQSSEASAKYWDIQMSILPFLYMFILPLK